MSLVKILYETNKIDVNDVDDEQWTALHWASKNGHFDIMEYLIKLPCIDINVKQKDGVYILFFLHLFTFQYKMKMKNV